MKSVIITLYKMKNKVLSDYPKDKMTKIFSNFSIGNFI
tara:strand:- start:392 stop:505 length:114 start_codon:yes stop_codon:yes gene_type:complete